MPATHQGTNGGFRASELTRREFQDTTAAAIDRQAFALQQLQERFKISSEFIADLSVRVDELSRAITAEEIWRKEDIAALSQRNKRSRWQRVRDFLFGQ